MLGWGNENVGSKWASNLLQWEELESNYLKFSFTYEFFFKKGKKIHVIVSSNVKRSGPKSRGFITEAFS